ncbi:MAG: hypothetical protein CEO22_424 [Candidatus Berkelbacteria bacterium Gr01-1014_85]|uniref:Uncharacterized protein n=1 Tax=Candidatus Berkelbacteria bacterium Gr01-1014_85 TaxID=2017150 RepID=A0A554JB66_9BACT|nr:MAG: hypothetical protein CEO22_424 [Candidatus Berkelbacteria bacterium Gr01-1014_85]
MDPYQPNRRRRLAAVVGGFFVLGLLTFGAVVSTNNQGSVGADALPTFADDPESSDGPYTFNPINASDVALDSYVEAVLDLNKNCLADPTTETAGYTASTVTDSTLRLFSSLPAGQYIVTAYGNDEPLVGTLCVVAGSASSSAQAVKLVPGGDPVDITLVELTN